MKHYNKERRWKIVGILTVLLGFLVAGIILVRRHQDPRRWFVDFDYSLKTADYQQLLSTPWAQGMYRVFKALYAQNNLALVSYQTQPRIPKKIHQIWLGSPFPEKYRVLQESWQKMHPEWEYTLWTDDDVERFGLKNKDIYDRAVNYGERSDIARYEILYRHGGLYVDTDYECLRPLDLFNHCYDFYIGIQPLDTNIMQLGIGLIGATAGHPFLKILIDGLPDNAHVKQIIKKTGPVYVSRMFAEHMLALPGVNIALPPTYFYPLGYTQDAADQKSWRKEESFAVHHWHGSWLKRDAFLQQARPQIIFEGK